MPDSTLPDLVDAFESAVEAEEFAAATAVLDDLESAYADLESDEAAALARALAARDRGEIPASDRERLSEYARHHTATELSRGSILSLGAIYLSYPSQVDTERLFQATDQLREQEEEYVTHEESVASVTSTVELPPQFALVASVASPEPHLLGESLTVEFTVENIGDESATDVALSVSGATAVDPADTSLGTLDAGATTTVAVSVTPEESGETTITGRVAAANADPTERRVSVTVYDKEALLAVAEDSLAELQSAVDATDLSGGQRRSLTRKLAAAAASVDRAKQFVEAGRDKQADNQCLTATRQVGAFLNALDSSSKGRRSLDEQAVFAFDQRGEMVVDQLVAVTDAPE